jgi:hypothetical protein
MKSREVSAWRRQAIRLRRTTPLHWAASSDDVDVAAALMDGGADVDAPDGSIGTPLENAVGYACWSVAALLAVRGARVHKLWHAAALGLLDRLQQLSDSTQPTTEELSQAFWHACSAGRRRAAEFLLAVGAEPNWVLSYAEGTPLDAAGERRMVAWTSNYWWCRTAPIRRPPPAWYGAYSMTWACPTWPSRSA